MTINDPSSSEGLFHGPYRSLTDKEIAERERYEYERTLSAEERLALQSMHQISETAWTATEAGRTEYARPLHNKAQQIHIDLLNAGG